MPPQPGLGWLLDIWPNAIWVIPAFELVITLAAIGLLFAPKSRTLNGEERELFWFIAVMLLTPISLLVGIAFWFACDSFVCGAGAAIALPISAIAFLTHQ